MRGIRSIPRQIHYQNKCRWHLMGCLYLPTGIVREGVFMKKIMYFATLVIIVFMTITGCTSYKGAIDHSVPVSEMAMLKIDANLNVIEFNGESVNWRKTFYGARLGNGWLNIAIPAGEHTFTFNYHDVRGTGRTAQYEIITITTAEGLTLSGTFEAGNTYKINTQYISDNRIQVQSTLEEEGEAIARLSSPEQQWVNGLFLPPMGVGYYSAWTFGRVNETEVRRTAWNIEFGTGIAVPLEFMERSEPISLHFNVGANYEYYFGRNGKSGIIIGGGVMTGDTVYPYIRIGMPFITRGGAKWGLYGSYFFRDILPENYAKAIESRGSSNGTPHPVEDYGWKMPRFGSGIYFAF